MWQPEVVATSGAKKLMLENIVKISVRCWATYQGAVKPILRSITPVKTGWQSCGSWECFTKWVAWCGEGHVEPANHREVLNIFIARSPSGFKFCSKASLNLISDEGFYSICNALWYPAGRTHWGKLLPAMIYDSFSHISELFRGNYPWDCIISLKAASIVFLSG